MTIPRLVRRIDRRHLIFRNVPKRLEVISISVEETDQIETYQ